MPEYRRFQQFNPDDLYFLTIVTKNRIPFLKGIEIKRQLWSELDKQAKRFSGKLLAYVFLDDHIHLVLEQENGTFSRWIENFKRRINFLFENEKSIWQKRFWEHRIRNYEDLIHACDYIHFNPVKHGYIKSPFDFKASSFKTFVKNGLYPKDWASCDEYDSFEGYGE